MVTAIVMAMLCECMISEMSDEGCFAPANVFAGSFLYAVVDNIDINEETKSGEGKTHVLGSVIYQAKREMHIYLHLGLLVVIQELEQLKI